MKIFKYFVVATSTLAFCASSFAATVTSIEGPLQVNTGSGFHPVVGAAQVSPGGSVMVGPGAKGEILYSDGCKTPVTPGSVAVVAPVSPCAQGQYYGGQDYTLYYVLGAAAAVGLGVGIWAATKGNNNNNNNVVIPPHPASP